MTAWKEKAIHPLDHTIQRYARVFERLGYPVTVSESDVLPRKPFPANLPLGENTGYRIGIAPFAAHEGKCYPEEDMQEVLAMLGRQTGVQVYLFGGGAKEVAVLEAWEKGIPTLHFRRGENVPFGRIGPDLQPGPDGIHG